MQNIHVCLVSAQLLPNIIPVLMHKPDKVCLVVTKTMQVQATILENFLTKRDFKVKVYPEAPDHNSQAIMDFALEIIAELDQDDTDVMLNVTGGNKLMALAFSNVFSSNENTIFYTDTRYQHLEHLEQGHVPEPLSSVLKIPDYLEAQNLTFRHALSDQIHWQQTCHARKKVTKFLGHNSTKLAEFFGVMNNLAGHAVESAGYKQVKLKQAHQELVNFPRGIWFEALNNIHQAGLIAWDEAQSIDFIDLEKTSYINGLWLEEYCWHIANDIGFDDIRCGVEITWNQGSRQHAPRNEFDLLIVHQNRMLVIECKTANMGFAQLEKNQTIVSKLESLGNNAGGTFGQQLLVSARELKEDLRSRCLNQHIDVVEKAGLVSLLKEKLQKWKLTGDIR
jgi:hypothetical protein